MAGTPDIALISPGTTFGWRHNDEVLARGIVAAGASCEVRRVRFGAAGRLRLTMSSADLIEALASRRAARGVGARAVVYSSITAALLQPVRGRTAIRYDGLASVNRPGIGGAWQRRREPGVLERASLLLPFSEGGEAQARALGVSTGAVVLGTPLRTASPAADAPAVVAYAANPEKRGLELMCAVWGEAAPSGARMAIAGIDAEAGREWLARHHTPEPPGIEWLGVVEHGRWLGLVAGARAYLSAARIEDFGQGQLEALAAGTPLVTAPAPGANAALPLARALDPALVASKRSLPALAAALGRALALTADQRAGYADGARLATAPYSEEAVNRTLAEDVLPRLLDSRSS